MRTGTEIAKTTCIVTSLRGSFYLPSVGNSQVISKIKSGWPGVRDIPVYTGIYGNFEILGKYTGIYGNFVSLLYLLIFIVLF